MKRRLLSAGMLLTLVAFRLASSSRADEPPPKADPPKFVRVDRTEAGDLKALQTAVVSYTDAKRPGLTVDLVGAVHVGDKSYYEALNKLFEGYDVVLYELVAPEGTQVPQGAKANGNPVAMLQTGLKDMLGLEHQLEQVDYTKKNFVHADMSPDDFSKSMEDKGESMLGMFFRMMGQGMSQQNNKPQRPGSEFELLAALFSDDRAGAMRRIMAEQFDSMDGVMQALEGPQGSTIITERNKVALKKVGDQITAGQKKIAVFYGAGHLPDMEKRLLADYQLSRSSERWLDAWNLEKKAPAAK